MCKELVSIPWTSKPWVLSECHCLMPDYFVSNILSVCNLAVAWFEHNYSIPSLRKNSGWRAVYRALLIFPACFGSLGAILAILLLHVAFHGGAWQDFKGRKQCLPVSFVMRAMVISKKIKYISVALKLHTHLSVQVQLGNSISFHVDFQATEHTTLRSHSLSAQQTHHWYDTSPQLRQTLRPIHPKNHHHYSCHPK